MGAVPKRKPSTRRKGARRSQQKVKLPTLATCKHCGQPKRSHIRCSNCKK